MFVINKALKFKYQTSLDIIYLCIFIEVNVFTHDTNKCTFDILYTNTILYHSYMLRHHAILGEFYTKI
jgi:hypothetical protein